MNNAGNYEELLLLLKEFRTKITNTVPYQRHDVLVFPTICECGKGKGKKKILAINNDEQSLKAECLSCRKKTELSFYECSKVNVKYEPKPRAVPAKQKYIQYKVYYGGSWGNGR